METTQKRCIGCSVYCFITHVVVDMNHTCRYKHTYFYARTQDNASYIIVLLLLHAHYCIANTTHFSYMFLPDRPNNKDRGSCKTQRNAYSPFFAKKVGRHTHMLFMRWCSLSRFPVSLSLLLSPASRHMCITCTLQHTYIATHGHLNIRPHTYVCVCAYMCIFVYMCILMCMCICICVSMYVCTCEYVCVCLLLRVAPHR